MSHNTNEVPVQVTVDAYTHEGSLHATVCSGCGALVVDEEQHDGWHLEQARRLEAAERKASDHLTWHYLQRGIGVA